MIKREYMYGKKLREECGMEMSPNEVAPAIWGTWLTPALEKGILKCKPEAEVVGRGLENIQEACDLMSKGVSAAKLVVELP